MAELPAAVVTEVVRALAIYFQLPNLAEEIHAHRGRREQLAREGVQWMRPRRSSAARRVLRATRRSSSASSTAACSAGLSGSGVVPPAAHERRGEILPTVSLEHGTVQEDMLMIPLAARCRSRPSAVRPFHKIAGTSVDGAVR